MRAWMRYVCWSLACAALVFASNGVALAVAPEVTLPTDLPDISGAVTLVITALGLVVAAVLAGYFGFLLIRKGIRWAGRAAG